MIVSYERPELLERTVKSYMETVTVPHWLMVVDNSSAEETRRMIDALFADGYIDSVMVLPENKYPGYACNEGWKHAHDDVTHYHRSDNDVEYKPGWCDEVVRCFQDEDVWQLGLRTLEEEGPHPNVGGNCVIPRVAYEAGIRYSGASWVQQPFEDTQMSARVLKAGKKVARVEAPCIEHIGLASREDPYYQETFRVRRITFDQYGL